MPSTLDKYIPLVSGYKPWLNSHTAEASVSSANATRDSAPTSGGASATHEAQSHMRFGA